MLEFFFASIATWGPALPLATSLISAGLSVNNLYRTLQKLKPLEETRSVLLEKKLSRMVSAGTGDDEILLEALSLSAHIVGPLRSKLTTEVIATVGLVFVAFAGSAGLLELSGAEGANRGEDVILLSLLPFLIVCLGSYHRSLNKDERDFLDNLAILHFWFYEAYVYEAMVEFNLALSKVTTFRIMHARWDRRKEKLVSELRKGVSERFTQYLGPGRQALGPAKQDISGTPL